MGISPQIFCNITSRNQHISGWKSVCDLERQTETIWMKCVPFLTASEIQIWWCHGRLGDGAQGWSMYKALAGFNTQHHSKKKLSGKNIWEENNGLTLEIQSRRGAGNGGVRVQKHTSFKDPFHYEVVLTFWVWSAIANQIQCIIKYLLYCF